jgi:hypothetical protein
MAKTWNDMVDEAKAQTTAVTPVEAQQKLQNDPDALLIEVRDKDVVPEGQRTPETLMISLGFLPFRADLEVAESMREPLLADRSRQIMVT